MESVKELMAPGQVARYFELLKKITAIKELLEFDRGLVIKS